MPCQAELNARLLRISNILNSVNECAIAAWIGNNEFELAIIIVNEKELVGYVQFVDFHKNNRSGYLGICLREKFRNSGFGTQTLNLTFVDLKKQLGVRKVLLKVRKDNPAVFLYEKLGFDCVGELKNEYYDGNKYWNVIIYEKFI